MQILRDGGRIRSQRRQARLLTGLGVALLVGALIASNAVTGVPPETLVFWLIGSYVALIGGFICFNVGLQGVAKWSRRPRGDERIDNHLKRLNDRFTIFHYASLGGKLYDHIVVHPGGVTVLITRDTFGPVSYRDGRWRKDAAFWKRLLNWAGPPVGNPHGDAASVSANLQEYLHSQGVSVEVDAVIVFVSPQVQLSVEDSAIPVRRVDDLASLLTERAMESQLAGNQRLEVIKALTAGIRRPDETTPAASRGRVRGSPRFRPATRVPPTTGPAPTTKAKGQQTPGTRSRGRG